MNKGMKTIGILLILLCSISGSAYAREDMSGKVGLGSKEYMPDRSGLDSRANGFTNLIDSKIRLLESEIENSDDLSFIEEAELMIFELDNVRNEMQEASNEDEFASSLNKFNSLMENSSEDIEQIFMGGQKMSVDRIVDVGNKSVQMNDSSGDMKSSIMSDERDDPIKNVSSRSKIVNGNENETSNSNFLTRFVNKIMSFF
ncbi:hypothetical protein [Methanococcoides alaskense]|uniref:DUF5667 domain-containing protein n=1 Tax=Methanococcoides alaskense TaxID=325778 RepID=A0AA90TZ13_9EURY|nr:hypothetical protein [Methanococcoides alaskense]MDA0525547.1 hypothetical protein [Methanococcoides alaskense]MDR6222328.1 hypothetical protein [Methanococcoides alaskense]